MNRFIMLMCCCCSTLCNPMDCSLPCSPVLHYLPEFPQIHVHWIRDNIPSNRQNIEASASASVLPVSVQGWYPLGWIGWISLKSKRLFQKSFQHHSWKHQFFGAQPFTRSKSNICTWLLEKPIVLTRWTFVRKVMSLLFNSCVKYY